MEETYDIEHQEDQHRFVLLVEGMESELTYKRHGDVIVFDHTEVPPQLQHRGLANHLAEAALGYARERNLQVDPQCRFMAVYIERHRQWQDLLRKPKQDHPTPQHTR
jgi:predicted GNAT family acetyltransferase